MWVLCAFVFLAGGEAHRTGRDHGPGEAVAVAPGAAAARARDESVVRVEERGHQPVVGPSAIEPDPATDRVARQPFVAGHSGGVLVAPPPSAPPGRERRQQQHRVGAPGAQRWPAAQQDPGGQGVVVLGAQAPVVVPRTTPTPARRQPGPVPVVEQIQVGPIVVAPELGIDQQQDRRRRRVVHRQRRRQTANRRQTGLAAAAAATGGRQAAPQGPQGLGWQRRHVTDASQIAKPSSSPPPPLQSARRRQRLQDRRRNRNRGRRVPAGSGRRYQQGTADQEVRQHT